MLWTGALLAQSFSIDIPSPGITPPVPGDAILGSGPVGPYGVPPVALPAPVLVPGAGPGIEVNALSYPVLGHFAPDGVTFSVSPGRAGGVGTAVAAQFATLDEPADIHRCTVCRRRCSSGPWRRRRDLFFPGASLARACGHPSHTRRRVGDHYRSVPFSGIPWC